MQRGEIMDSELIYAISEIDKEALIIEREINEKTIPQKLSKLRDDYTEIKNKYEALILEYEKNSKAIIDLTAKNDSLLKESKEMEDKLYNSSNIKSIEIIQHSLDRLNNQIQNNESAIYIHLEEQEKDKKSKIEFRNKLNELSKLHNSMKNEYQEHITSLNESISKLKEKRMSIMSKLDIKIVNEYESIRKSKGYGMSLLKGEICTGCGMSVPYIIINDAKKHTILQNCPNCGRFIYIKG
jgi:predicted  nucleic acid-binding Zn-ribbon protein